MCAFRMKCISGIILSILLSKAAFSQNIEAHLLCIHNGGEVYANGPFFGYPNHGSGKYFPSFAHWASTPQASGGGSYPLKILGWSWRSGQASDSGPGWAFETCLQKSRDNPYATTMSWDYPSLFCKGLLPPTGPPDPIFSGVVPSGMPVIGGHGFIFPSSQGGFDPYLNIFAVFAASWWIPSTSPGPWDFGIIIKGGAASAITVPSAYSIWEYVWTMKGPHGQYIVLSNNEIDCLGNPGNKGRNYSLVSDYDNGQYWYWPNTGGGAGEEWVMCLLVCDAVTIPVNSPGDQSNNNPFAYYGFDVGSSTLTPLLSSGALQLGFMSQDYTNLGGTRFVLASFASLPCVGPYGKKNYRMPHGFDALTHFFLNVWCLYVHKPSPYYPASMFGTTVGANTIQIPFPPLPGFLGAEVRYSSYAMGAKPGLSAPMSASYMVTYF